MTLSTQLSHRYPGLRFFSDNTETRACMPIALDQVVYQHTPTPAPRAIGEILDIVEQTIGGKFSLPVELDPSKALAPASGRTVAAGYSPLATIEVWSLQPGSYDLVLRLPNQAAQNEALLGHLIAQLVDRAQEITRVVDNTDLLRFQAGPSLSVCAAQAQLAQLERKSGTRLDTESLLSIISSRQRPLLN